jgi:NAD(P)-dependent dehydrogenase (short-subunit alcohol dehydrogenase family)
MDLQLEGKTALVTGGSRGIGKAIARELALEGVDVAIMARGREALEATAAELGAETGRRIVALPGDTGDDESVRRVVAAAVEHLGRLDILVNNAAYQAGGSPPLADIRDDEVWAHLNVKLLGYLRCARAVAPHMAAHGWGRIVNISGILARSAGVTVTSVRNAAIVALAKNLSVELGPQGISVTTVHPGWTRTENTPEAAVRQMPNGNALRRVIEARDVAAVVTFLCSPRAVAINGDVIAAGGGVGSAIYY